MTFNKRCCIRINPYVKTVQLPCSDAVMPLEKKSMSAVKLHDISSNLNTGKCNHKAHRRCQDTTTNTIHVNIVNIFTDNSGTDPSHIMVLVPSHFHVARRPGRRRSFLEGSARRMKTKKPKGVWPPFKVKTSARTPSGNN